VHEHGDLSDDDEHHHDAFDVQYDPTLSGLPDNVQEAIDALAADSVPGDGSAATAGDFIAGALSNPPTQAEIEALIGSPGAVARGTVYGLQDSGTEKRYLALSDGVQWHIVPLVVPQEQEGTVALTSSPDGGWSGGQPSAAYYNGVTYFAYIDGTNGNAEARTYTHATGVISSPTVLHAVLDVDNHSGPSLLVRASDHRVMFLYSAHSGAALYQWVSTNPEDISAGTETNLDAQLGGTAYTYESVVEITAGIMLVVRPVAEGTGQSWAYAINTSDGDPASWPALTTFFSVAGRTAYPTIAKTGANRVDVVASDGNSLQADTSIVHFYFDGLAWRDSAGTAITLPVNASTATKVWDGAAGNDAYSRDDVTIGVDGKPRVLFSVDTGADYTYYHGRWTGSAWVNTVIATYTNQPAGARFDSLNPNIVWACIDGELFRYSTIDEVTWGGISTGITGTDVFYPVSPTDHAPDLPVMVLVGTFTDFDTFSLGIAGFGDEAAAATDENLQRIVFLDDATLGEYIVQRTSAGAWQVSRDGGSNWESLGGGASGAAGGDLSGTYPNPSVVDDSHNHTSATAPGGGIGPLLLSSDHSAPIVFDDILQASDGSDLLYASEP
jgi:hypothetical protein